MKILLPIVYLFLITVGNKSVAQITYKAHGHVGYVNDKSNRYHSPLDIGVWSHVAFTKDVNNNANVYKDGQLVFQGKFDNVSYSWNRIDLGAVFYTSYGGWFKGMIDELRISNKARTATEIAAAYAALAPFSADANTVGLWHFDQSSGTSVTSSIGGSGTLTNSIWDAQGKFGQCLSFNGTNARAVLNQSVPTTNMTIEFWVKPTEIKYCIPLSMYGMYTSSYGITNDTLFSNTNSVHKSAVEIYPNPVSDILNLDFKDNGKIAGCKIEIMNISGKCIYNSYVNQRIMSINLSNRFGKGLYIVNIRDTDGILLESKKIILY
jgi:hypothetical protein